MPLIHVTQEDIDRGGHRCDFCPVHHALLRHGLDSDWLVSSLGIEMKPGLDVCSIPILSVSMWVINYDHFKTAQPFTFFLSAELFMR